MRAQMIEALNRELGLLTAKYRNTVMELDREMAGLTRINENEIGSSQIPDRVLRLTETLVAVGATIRQTERILNHLENWVES